MSLKHVACCLRPSYKGARKAGKRQCAKHSGIAVPTANAATGADGSGRDYKKFIEDARAHILYGGPKPASGTGLPARGTWGNRSGGDLAGLDANPNANPAGAAAASANGGGAAVGDAPAKPHAGQGREEGGDSAAPPPAPAAEALPRQATADAAEFLTAKSAPQASLRVQSRALLRRVQLCMRSMPSSLA